MLLLKIVILISLNLFLIECATEDIYLDLRKLKRENTYLKGLLAISQTNAADLKKQNKTYDDPSQHINDRIKKQEKALKELDKELQTASELDLKKPPEIENLKSDMQQKENAINKSNLLDDRELQREKNLTENEKAEFKTIQDLISKDNKTPEEFEKLKKIAGKISENLKDPGKGKELQLERKNDKLITQKAIFKRVYTEEKLEEAEQKKMNYETGLQALETLETAFSKPEAKKLASKDPIQNWPKTKKLLQKATSTDDVLKIIEKIKKLKNKQEKFLKKAKKSKTNIENTKKEIEKLKAYEKRATLIDAYYKSSLRLGRGKDATEEYEENKDQIEDLQKQIEKTTNKLKELEKLKRNEKL